MATKTTNQRQSGDDKMLRDLNKYKDSLEKKRSKLDRALKSRQAVMERLLIEFMKTQLVLSFTERRIKMLRAKQVAPALLELSPALNDRVKRRSEPEDAPVGRVIAATRSRVKVIFPHWEGWVKRTAFARLWKVVDTRGTRK